MRYISIFELMEAVQHDVDTKQVKRKRAGKEALGAAIPS